MYWPTIQCTLIYKFLFVEIQTAESEMTVLSIKLDLSTCLISYLGSVFPRHIMFCYRMFAACDRGWLECISARAPCRWLTDWENMLVLLLRSLCSIHNRLQQLLNLSHWCYNEKPVPARYYYNEPPASPDLDCCFCFHMLLLLLPWSPNAAAVVTMQFTAVMHV